MNDRITKYKFIEVVTKGKSESISFRLPCLGYKNAKQTMSKSNNRDRAANKVTFFIILLTIILVRSVGSLIEG